MVQQLLDLIRRTSCELPPDVQQALMQANLAETNLCAKTVLDAIQSNVKLAASLETPICQDTGTLTFFWRVPRATDIIPLQEGTYEAIRQATAMGYLRKNTIDTLTGQSLDDNIGQGIPVIHFEQEVDLQHLTVTLLLKGGGSENMSRQYSLPDTTLCADRDLAGARKCLIHAVHQIQGQGCAPGIIGVCIGADRAEGFTVAKQQLLRKLDDQSPNVELANLEARILSEVNTLGIGPMGTGGKTTLLGVKIATRPRLPASYFVTIAYICWACRRQTIEIIR